jgi:peroxiredoxin
MTDQPVRRKRSRSSEKSPGPNPWVILLLIFVVVGGGGAVLALALQNKPEVAVTTMVAPPESGPQPGSEPPNFRLPGLNQEDRELSELKGRPVMLFFWDSDCQPCIEMMRRLQTAAANQGTDLAVVLINTTFQDTQEAASSVVQPYSFSPPQFFILRDDTGSAVGQYEVKVLPTSYFIKRDGTVSEAWTGPLPDDVLNAALARIR